MTKRSVLWATEWALIGAACALAACAGGADAPAGDSDGGDQTPPNDSGAEGGGGDDCSERAKSVYLVSRYKAGADDASAPRLLRFDPPTKTITEVGLLTCSANPSHAPRSMAVDRQGIAWILYDNGAIYRVDVADASCEATTWPEAGQEGFTLFGMGFATNGGDTASETLFLSGAPMRDVAIPGPKPKLRNRIASLNTTTMTAAPRPNSYIGGAFELTGNALGELWGFHPKFTIFVEESSTFEGPYPAAIARFNTETGDIAEEFEFPAIGEQGAFAFAFWGGAYYIFLADSADPSGQSSVSRFDPVTEEISDYMDDTGYRIAGAGVSTCAPVTIL